MGLTKEQEKAIKGYADEIVTIEDFVEIVRKRPGMYLGPVGNSGLMNMIREIYQNAIDQIVKEKSPATHVIISYDERTHQVIIEDNGMGIPFGHIIRAFEDPHTSSHYVATPGVYQSGLNGVGAKIVNAMSVSFIIQSFVLGEARQVEWKDGKHITDEVEIKSNGKQGTVVMFIPSEDALGKLTATVQDVQNLLTLLLPLSPAGTKIIYNSIDGNGRGNTVTMINTDSIFGYVKSSSPVLKEPIYICNEEDKRTMKMECCINFDSEFNNNIIGFANFCPTLDGTHIKGFTDGVCMWFKNYMNTIYLSSAVSSTKKKKSQLIVEPNDVKSILRGVIHACSIEPNFTGQAKENLSNEEMLPYVKKAVFKGLDDWSAKNPQSLQKLCKFIKDVAEQRLAENNQKSRLAVKYASSFGGFPSKFVKPSGPKTHWEEFYVVEGDSALGTGKNARINQTQGLFPIRGKLPNAFNYKPSEILENAECSAILNIIGGGYGKNFDLSKVIWKKVGVLADADIDGGHIATLFLILMLKYCKPLVEDGRVYKAAPPLYMAKIKGKETYFTDQLDFNKYRQKEFYKKHSVKHLDGRPLSNIESLNLLYQNEDYVYWMNSIATTYAVDQLLLETILINRTNNIKSIGDALSKNNRFRFVRNIKQINDTILIDGLVNSKSNTVFLNDKLLKESKRIIDILEQNTEFYFDMDGNMISLYELMKAFDDDRPDIQRYKGLGEMDGKKLKESTLDPEGSRQIIRYSVNDIVEEVETLRYFNSNMNLIGEGVKVNRIDLMD